MALQHWLEDLLVDLTQEIRRTRKPEVIVSDGDKSARSSGSRKKSVECNQLSREVPKGSRGAQEQEMPERIESWSQRAGVALEESEPRREDGPDHAESH